jgi:hypothetical protein
MRRTVTSPYLPVSATILSINEDWAFSPSISIAIRLLSNVISELSIVFSLHNPGVSTALNYKPTRAKGQS